VKEKAMPDQKSNSVDSFKRAVCSIVAAVLIGWLGWVSFGAISVDKRVTVVESTVAYIREDITEMKVLVKEIRQDQLRRERRDNGGSK
jgi:hypothetical protein